MMIKSPIIKMVPMGRLGSFRTTRRPTTVVPPVVPPAFKISPRPIPITTPPNTDANSISSVKGGSTAHQSMSKDVSKMVIPV